MSTRHTRQSVVSSSMPIWKGALILGAIHLTVALVYHLALHVDTQDDAYWNVWDGCWWHLIPTALLKTDLLRNVFYMHSQPPLYNLYGSILVRIFGDNLLVALNRINILAGSLLSAMIYVVARRLTQRPVLAWVWSAVLALNPALFLYEAYPLYTMATAFWVMTTVVCVLWHENTHSAKALYCMIISLNLMILTRSLYHAILLLVALAFVWLVSTQKRVRTLLICAAICLPTVAVYGKNYVLYRFVGDSSWSGMGLWLAVVQRYSEEDLLALADAGVIDPMVARLEAFYTPPSEYESYGFRKRSDIPILAKDDPNNINVPDIAAVYQANALRLLWHDPGHYARNMFSSYGVFCRPSTRFKHLVANAPKLGWHERFYAEILQGMNIPLGRGGYGVYLILLLPCALGLYPLLLLLRLARERWNLRRAVQAEGLLLWCFVLIAYTTAANCAAGYMEQQRFKFLVEAPIWLFMPVVLVRSVREAQSWLDGVRQRRHRGASVLGSAPSRPS